MGFFGVLKDVVLGILEYGSETAEKFNGDMSKYKRRYEGYDTERLKSLYLRSKGIEKMAILSILKDRGEMQ